MEHGVDFIVFVWSMVWVLLSLCGAWCVFQCQCVEHDVGFSVFVEQGVGFSVCVWKSVWVLVSLCGVQCGLYNL